MTIALLILVVIALGCLAALLVAVHRSSKLLPPDITARMDTFTATAAAVADELTANLGVERAEFARLVVLLSRLESMIAEGGATGMRIEADATAGRDRADKVAGAPGAKADAAASAPRARKRR